MLDSAHITNSMLEERAKLKKILVESARQTKGWICERRPCKNLGLQESRPHKTQQTLQKTNI